MVVTKILSVCVGIAWVVLFYLLFFWAKREDAKAWNNGHCTSCGNLWERFDTDSQGGRGYKCECGKSVWVSYAVDTVR